MKIVKILFIILLASFSASCQSTKRIISKESSPPKTRVVRHDNNDSQLNQTAPVKPLPKIESVIIPLDKTEDATEIVKRSDDLMRGDSIQGIYIMKITTPQWQRRLELQVFSFEREKTFIRILSPEKEAGIGTLRIKNEMWNYLPRIEKLIKVPPSVMMQPWMGSDFNNDDLVKESSIVNDYTHAIIGTEEIHGRTAYKIELQPKPGASIVWGKVIRWVSHNDFIPLKEEYYNEKSKLIKVLEYSNIDQISDRVIPKIWKMTSLIEPGHITTITIIEAEYNKPIDDSIFSLTNLKNI